MKITGGENEQAILAEIGFRIKQRRISLGLKQTELAERCGISTSTETRIESGADSKLSNYLKILSGLNLLGNIDILIPEEQPDLKLLYEMLYEKRKPRQRVKTSKPKAPVDWVWGEDK